MPSSCFYALREREKALPRHISANAATFRSEVSGSNTLIHRMELQRTLEGHGGCVNTVSFNPAGDLLVSGSDDQTVMLWDWRRGAQRLRFKPGHYDNIFQARYLPGSYDKTLVSCAADGQVRVSYFREGSSRPISRRLHHHTGRAHKLALQDASPYDPAYGSAGSGGPPCFYSSGEDGDVCFFDLRVSDSMPLGRMTATALGWTASAGGDGGGGGGRSRSSDEPGRRRSRQIIDLSAVHVNPARPWQLVVGGANVAVVVYDNRCLTSLTSAYGGGDSGGAAEAGACTTARCRRVQGRPLLQLWPANLRQAADSRHRSTSVTCVIFGQNGDVLASYNNDDVYLFRPPGTQGSGGGRGRPGSTGDSDSEDEDVRRCRASAAGTAATGGPGGVVPGSNDVSSKDGNNGDDDEFDSFLRPSQRRRRGSAMAAPGLSSRDRDSAAESSDFVIGRYSGHVNNRTIKGVNFLGEREEWVVSGSDCGNIFIWSRDSCRLQCCMKGDMHVVNCLEPHPTLPLHMATSGIDDDIKLWAPTAAEPRSPGRTTEAVVTENQRVRSAAQFLEEWGAAGPLSPHLLPHGEVLQMLLADMTREGGGGARQEWSVRDLLMRVLQARRHSNDDDDGDDDDDDDDDDNDNDEEEEEVDDDRGRD